MKKKDETLELLSVRIPEYQKMFLAQHKEMTGNSPGLVIRLLLDYYISLDPSNNKDEIK